MNMGQLWDILKFLSDISLILSPGTYHNQLSLEEILNFKYGIELWDSRGKYGEYMLSGLPVMGINFHVNLAVRKWE